MEIIIILLRVTAGYQNIGFMEEYTYSNKVCDAEVSQKVVQKNAKTYGMMKPSR